MRRAVQFWLSSTVLAAAGFAQPSDYERGAALFESGRPAEAVPFLRRAAEAHPREAQMWKALGVAYAAQGQYGQAEAPLHRACDLDAKLPGACYFYAKALYALDRFAPALDVLESAAKREPESWQIRLGIAEAVEGLSQTARAEQEFRRALSLCRTTDPKPAIGFARFLIRQGRYDEAVAPLELALQRFGASGDAHLQLGRALLEKGDLAGAIPHLERAVALDPASAQAHLLLAKAYVRAGRAADAEPHFQAAARVQQAGRQPR